jgi:ubiquinone/menaquinone biosynthesis C-methylase UbiE
MEQRLQEIREQQKASWNKFSPGWRKWDHLMMDFLHPMGDAIIYCLAPQDNQLILDVASGTGEPGLTIAALIPEGKVVITDLAEHMLEVADEHAKHRGISNIEIMACDVCELPFADNSFDAISCRMGFMFFPDMQLAANEMVRVLKPGGKLATAFWNGPEKNFWVTAIGGTINRNMQLEPPPPEAPGMFRCAKPGLIADLFVQAGLHQLTEQEVTSEMHCGSIEVYWEMMTEVAAPFVAALSKADDAMKEKIKTEVFQLVHEKFRDGLVNINASAQVICGQK